MSPAEAAFTNAHMTHGSPSRVMPRHASHPPLHRQMGEYEETLADAQRLYKRMTRVPTAERAAAKRDYEHALQRARELGARVARELDRHAHAA